jgi:hypothetical protein
VWWLIVNGREVTPLFLVFAYLTKAIIFFKSPMGSKSYEHYQRRTKKAGDHSRALQQYFDLTVMPVDTSSIPRTRKVSSPRCSNVYQWPNILTVERVTMVKIATVELAGNYGVKIFKVLN